MNRLIAGGFEAGLDEEDELMKKGKQYDYPWMAANKPNRNAPWEHYSLDTIERAQKEEAEKCAREYRPSFPGANESIDKAELQRQAIQAREYKHVKPWDCPQEELDREEEEALNKQMEAIACSDAYTSTCPWKPEEMTDKQKQQLAEYKYTTPYQTARSEPMSPPRPAKRPTPGRNPMATTTKPWEYGKEALPPSKPAEHPQPATSLWDVPPPPKEDPAAAAMESSGDPILDNLRMQLKKHGASGILGLARKFKIMDDDKSGTLDMNEFTKAMKECDVADLSKAAIGHLFRYFDRDDSGSITYDEFLVGIRGVLNPRRKALVAMAFDVLDKDKSGEVTIDDIREAYDATGHPDVLRGARTLDQVLEEFLSTFEVGGDVDGIITFEEFSNYYSNISASVDNDDYFELMIRNAWHISGGEGWCANTTNKRVLVTHADGTQTVEEIKNDLGLKAGDKKGMMERLLQQGVTSLVGVDTSGGTDGSKGKGGDGSQHLEALQRRAAQMGLTRGGGNGSGNNSARGGSLGGSGGGVSMTGSANRQGLAPKPLSLAAALNKQPPPTSTSSQSSSRANVASGSGLSAQGQGLARPVQNPGTGRPVAAPPMVRPLSGGIGGMVSGGGSIMSLGSNNGLPKTKPKSLSSHLNYSE